MESFPKAQNSRTNFFIKIGIIAIVVILGLHPAFASQNAKPSSLKIYCAGPLFNDSEREMMSKIAKTLEDYGFKTYLPQRDGFEFAELSPALIKAGVPPQKAQQLLNKIIFCFDIYNLLECDATVFNMNGRVPDGGSIVEASVSWAFGHPLVIYKNDPRTLMLDIDNPMITGLSKFKKVHILNDVPKAIYIEIKNSDKSLKKELYPEKVKKIYDVGQKISKIKEQYKDYILLCKELLKLNLLD